MVATPSEKSSSTTSLELEPSGKTMRRCSPAPVAILQRPSNTCSERARHDDSPTADPTTLTPTLACARAWASASLPTAIEFAPGQCPRRIMIKARHLEHKVAPQTNKTQSARRSLAPPAAASAVTSQRSNCRPRATNPAPRAHAQPKRGKIANSETPAISRPFSRASARALSSLIAPKARRHTPSGNRRASARRWPPCGRDTQLSSVTPGVLVPGTTARFLGLRKPAAARG